MLDEAAGCQDHVTLISHEIMGEGSVFFAVLLKFRRRSYEEEDYQFGNCLSLRCGLNVERRLLKRKTTFGSCESVPPYEDIMELLHAFPCHCPENCPGKIVKNFKKDNRTWLWKNKESREKALNQHCLTVLDESLALNQDCQIVMDTNLALNQDCQIVMNTNLALNQDCQIDEDCTIVLDTTKQVCNG